MAIGVGAALAGGALLGGVSGVVGRDKHKDLVTRQENTPFQAPYLTYGFDEAKDLYMTPRSYFNSRTFVEPDQATIDALQLIEDMARAGDDGINLARDINDKTLSGNYLMSNPYLQQAIDEASKATTRNFRKTVMPKIDSQFAMSNRQGSNAHLDRVSDAEYNLADNLSDIATKMYYSNYINERDKQNSAISMSPYLAESGYKGKLNYLENLIKVGATREEIAQQYLNEDIDRFNFQQNEKRQRLNEYMQLVQGNYGGSSVSVRRNPNYKSKANAFLGGAMGGAGMTGSMYNMLNTPPTQNSYNIQ